MQSVTIRCTIGWILSALATSVPFPCDDKTCSEGRVKYFVRDFIQARERGKTSPEKEWQLAKDSNRYALGQYSACLTPDIPIPCSTIYYPQNEITRKTDMADIVAKGKKTRSATVPEPADKISPELVKLLDEKREAFARAEEELGTVVLPLATDKNLSFAELLTTGGVSNFTNQDDWQQAFQISLPEGDTKPKEDAIDQASHPQSKHTTWRSLRGRLTLEDKKTGEDPIEPPTVINHDLDSLPTICRLDHYDMKLYGNMPLSDDCVVIKCRSCGKPVIPSAFIYHTENCTRESRSGITPPRYVEPPPGKLAPSMKKRRTSAVADSGAKGENEENPSAGGDTSKGPVQGKAIKSSTIPKNMAKVGASAANSTAPSSTTTSPSSSPAKGKGIDDKNGSDGKGLKGDKGKKKVKITNKASARNKGPIDLDRQCGVRVFPSMAMCTRSLTCKSHSMSSKRGVLGRSQPYDELLALYQSKSIGRPKTSEKGDNPEGVVTSEVGSSCPAESKLAPGTVEARLAVEDTILDSDEEVDALMEALSSRALYPLATRPVHFYKRQREALRVREMLFEALQHQREAAVLNSAARRSHMNSHKPSFQQPHSSLHSRPIPRTVHSPHTTFQHIQHPMTPQQQHFVSPAQLQISNHVGDSG